MSRILIADDQRDVLEALRILLKGEGYQTEAVTSLAGIFSAPEKKDYALLIMDLNYTRDTTSGQEGLAAIRKIQEIDNTWPIVVMTAWASIDLAVEAMKRGARDFVTKPWENQDVEVIGIARNSKAVTLGETPIPMVYWPLKELVPNQTRASCHNQPVTDQSSGCSVYLPRLDPRDLPAHFFTA